uniref:Secretion-regulating guanine nucleotide exchange factor n=1 Tax=Schistocephalus solidus TaxID=70667 RepID=A0A0X3NSJ8_SCHSO
MSGWSHILALTELGNLYTWGRADFGQLGRTLTEASAPSTPSTSGDKPTVWPIKGKTFDPVPGRVIFGCTSEPQSPTEEVHITRVVAGSEHCLALDERQRLWSWGWNEHGMCGIGQVSEADNQTSDFSIRPLDPSDSDWCLKRPFLVRFPDPKPFPRILNIGSGYGHSFAVVGT